MRYEAVIGLEVHVQLRTETKLFCRCPNRFGAEPNTLVCPVCLGFPGTLPVLNDQAVALALRLALALGCAVPTRSVFARKNYFYPDLPKGYQISQYERPLAEAGRLPLQHADEGIAIRRLHLEEDAGKLLHELPGGGVLPGQSLVDFNRCGVPLVEIVTEPVLTTAENAQDFLTTLHQVLLYTETSDANLEQGSLRCDANVSLRAAGAATLGTKAEVKNLNSFRNLAKAIEYELDRQHHILESGGRVIQETRSFDAAAGVTRALRSKEEAHDYRYFDEPDLPQLVLDQAQVARARALLPELPWQRRARFERDFGLLPADARLLTADLSLAGYFERASGLHPGNRKAIANWVMTEVLRHVKRDGIAADQGLAPESLAELVALIDQGTITGTAAKDLFAAIWAKGERPGAALDRLGLRLVDDPEQLRAWVAEVIAEHPGPVRELREGKTKVLSFLVGQVMKRSGGRAQAERVRRLLAHSVELPEQALRSG